jgi:hypothetical protein
MMKYRTLYFPLYYTLVAEPFMRSYIRVPEKVQFLKTENSSRKLNVHDKELKVANSNTLCHTHKIHSTLHFINYFNNNH